MRQRLIVLKTILWALVGAGAVAYSVHLQNMFANQINTLRNIQDGNLKDHVPVLTEDEFGRIAQQTNLIINQLREKEKIQLGSKANLKANPGDRLLIETPGGGGYGRNK